MKLRSALIVMAVVALAGVATAQLEVFIDNNNPATGTSNTIPWGQAGGYTSLHVYTAAQLAAAGVCPGATLADFAVAPSSGTSGTYNAPQARLQIGHLAVDPPVAGAWTTHLDSPVIAHDITAGPYTFPWTLNTWTSLPGVSTAGFAWDGVRSIGILYTSSAGTTGTFNARRTPTNLRHGVNVFNATTQAPTTNGLFAMKTRMTWTGALAGQNSAAATLTFGNDPDDAVFFGNDAISLNVSSNTAPSSPFYLFFSAVRNTCHVPLTNQAFGLGATPASFFDVFALTPLGPQPVIGGAVAPFASLDAGGNFSVGATLPCGMTFPATAFQAGIVDGSHPDGIRFTRASTLEVRPGCKYASAAAFPVAIPDGPPSGVGTFTPIAITLSVPPGTTIADVDVCIDVTHTYYGDLNFTIDLNGVPLVSMTDGTPDSSSDLSGLYQLSDEGATSWDAASSATTGVIPTGIYSVDNLLSAFDGLDAGGTWTLTVTDTYATDIGTINNFFIVINGNQ